MPGATFLVEPERARGVVRRSVVSMSTFVTIQIGGATGADERAEREAAAGRALDWFDRVERCCSRFDETSELRQLGTRIGDAVPVSDMLFEAVQFAVAVAEETGGAFDPTVGRLLESRGFNREHRTGAVSDSAIDLSSPATYRDVQLDADHRTITLKRPLLLDLGAVAKGLAIDMAAREVSVFRDFAIDAGGDLYLAGHNPDGQPWSVGIRHPREDDHLLDVLAVSDRAVCTSGDYERRTPDGLGHHLIDPRTGEGADRSISATVIAPTAMLADALATAAFVLGPADGLRLLDAQRVDGLIVSASLERHATPGYGR